MSKKLDQLFEQARQSLQSEMPFEQVQLLIQKQPTSSFWTIKNLLIMTISMISIVTICSLLFWTNNNPTTATIVTTKKINTNLKPSVIQQENNIGYALADNLPLPIVANNGFSTAASTSQQNKNTRLDSLGPKETFTEYKLEIKKENSEQEIKKLKSELAQYGIQMNIKELSYNSDNNIKRFKGEFKTDSLFCGSNMDNYQFDISGSFKTMEFIFRVANNKNLKYLKIQSDDFEETIECYDDKVIANTKEAEKISMLMKREMAIAQADMARARAEMEHAKVEMERVMLLDRNAALSEEQLRKLERLNETNWEEVSAQIEEKLGKKFKGKKMEALHDALRDLDIRIEAEVSQAMRQLEEELHNMRLEIEHAIENDLRIEEISPLELEDDNKSAEELKNEAKELEEEAKRLRKEAKRKAKDSKK